MTTHQKAVLKYGKAAQIDMLIEEMSELTQALMKERRGRDHNVEEEIADVRIMLVQMNYLFDRDKVNELYDKKLNRLKNRLENEK